mgnify:FL=1
MSGLMALCSCSKEVMNDSQMERDSRLTVLTRSDGLDESKEIAMPIRYYVFNNEDVCVATLTQDDATTPVSAELAKGVYDVYAIGGADENRLVLPTQERAEKTTVVTLKDGQAPDDLMTAHSTVTLTSNGSNTLTLSLERKVCQIVSVTINNVPDGTEEVSVSISPLYESILLNGDYQGEGGSYTIPLTRQDNSYTWTETSTGIFLFPSVGKPTISVKIGDSTYSYNCQEEMASNYKISIEGTYTGEGPDNVTFKGTITGVSWFDEKNIRFNFNETGCETIVDNDQTDEGVIDTPVPEVGSLYQDCYVLAVNGKQATVLSPKEERDIVKLTNSVEEDVNEALRDWSVPNITATWELIDDSTLDLIESMLGQPGFPTFGSYGYLYLSSSKIDGFSISKGTINRSSSVPSPSCYLRPVATLTFK